MKLKKVKMRLLKTTVKLPKKQPNRRRSDKKQVKNLSRPGKVATDKTALDRVVIDKEEKFLYSDDELAKLQGKSGKKKDIDISAPKKKGEAKEENTVEVSEFYEARQLEKVAKEIAKYGLNIADYETDSEVGIEQKPSGKKGKKEKEKKPLFVVNGTSEIFSLKDLLGHVMSEGEKGIESNLVL